MTMVNQKTNLKARTMAVAMTMFSISMTKMLKGHHFHVLEDEEEVVAAERSTKEKGWWEWRKTSAKGNRCRDKWRRQDDVVVSPSFFVFSLLPVPF
jgi:hypothetical protein